MSNPKDTLEKAKVVDANGNPVGSADDVMLDKTGKPSSLKVDVGGFLGVGDKDVAMKASGCCQSNANSSPEVARFVNIMRVYTASIRHSAGAAERPCL